MHFLISEITSFEIRMEKNEICKKWLDAVLNALVRYEHAVFYP